MAPIPSPSPIRLPSRIAIAVLLLLASTADAQPPDALPADGPAYDVGRFEVSYFHGDRAQQPRLSRVMRLEVELGVTGTGYVAAREGIPLRTFKLREVAERPIERYHASALQSVLETIHAFMLEQALIGVYVAPAPGQLAATGADLRTDEERPFAISVMTALIGDIHTRATGERFTAEEAIDNPAHAHLVRRLPLGPLARKDRELLQRSTLDDQLEWLSRHPGRRVDAAVSEGAAEGTVDLDLIVNESKPLFLYAEVSNTGTQSTDEWRQRVGLLHTQLTNVDDILSLDYTTAGFDEVNAVTTSYEAPTGFVDRLHWRVFGSWSEYTASDLGQFGDFFTGRSWTGGGLLIGNVYQRDGLFVDVFGGLRAENHGVTNRLIGVSGEERFRIATFGARLEERTREHSIAATVSVDWNEGQDPAPDPIEVNKLGRLFPDAQFAILRWDVRTAFYLEPLLDPEGFADPTTPASSTLAHELALTFRGQYAFDNRLVPQFQQVIGGLHSVRGYPESIVAGDAAIIGSLEYRFHLPRAFSLQPEPDTLFGQPFRTAPQSVYGRPDWDLILRGFVDIGHTSVNRPLFFESDETLVGAGVGFEFVYRRNLNLRLDWGVALNGLDTRDVDAGSSRLHFLTRFLY